MTINISIDIIWSIIGVEGYGFGNDKKCYNTKRCKSIKQVMNNGTIGYKFHGKFYSLKKIKPLLYKPEKPKWDIVPRKDVGWSV